MLWLYRLLAVALVLGSITALQAGIGPDLINATSIEMGSAGTSDTTIARSGAGTITVEGTNVVLGTIGTSGATIPLLSTANTWTLDQTVPAEVYGVGWNSSNEVPTKNDVYDKIEALVVGGTVADADYGDITVSSSGSVWDIDSDAAISGSTPLITVSGTSAGAVGPILKLWHDSASPAAADIVTSIQANGGADDEVIGRVEYRLIDGATTTEDGSWDFYTDLAGTDTRIMTIGGGNSSLGTVIVGPGSTTNQVNAGGAFGSVTPQLTVTNSAATFTVVKQGGVEPRISMGSNRNATAGSFTIAQAGDSLGELSWQGSGTLEMELAARIYVTADASKTPGDNDMPGDMFIGVTADGGSDSTNAIVIDSSSVVMIGDEQEGNVNGAPSTGWNASNFTPRFQVMGDAQNEGSMGLFVGSDSTSGPIIFMGKSRSASNNVGYTISATNDEIGSIIFQGANGTDFTSAAQIQVKQQAGVGASADMPGALILATSANGSGTPTTNLSIDDDRSVVVGTSLNGATCCDGVSGWTASAIESHLTVTGNTASLGSMGIFQASADALGPHLYLGKSRTAASIDYGAVTANGDVLGTISFQMADGTDMMEGAKIEASVHGTAGAGTDAPTALAFFTSPDSSETVVRRMTIWSDGGVVVGNATTAVNPGRGGLMLHDGVPGSTAGGQLWWGEDSDNGNNYLGLVAPAAITANATCTMINQTPAFIPYECVGSTQPTVTVDGATTFAVTTSQVDIDCTGAESIDTITGGVTGMRLLLIHEDTDCTLKDDDAATASNAIDLTGTATDDVGAVHKIIELIYTSGHWEQVSESDN